MDGGIRPPHPDIIPPNADIGGPEANGYYGWSKETLYQPY